MSPSTDPLYQRVKLDHSVQIPVIGVPVTFLSNQVEGIAAAEESFGFWRTPGLASGSPHELQVRIIIHPGDEGGRASVPITWRMGGPRLVVAHTPGSMGVSDLANPQVTIYATETLLADRLHFCHGMLEALVLTVVNTLDRTPLHAAALVRRGTVLLLSGGSGAGKSTVVYAAVRAGFELVADDAVYVQRSPATAIWGGGTRVCLLPDTRRHFPELGEVHPSVLANGKTKMVVPVAPDRRASVPVSATRLVVVLLERGSGPVDMSQAHAGEVISSLTADLQVTHALFGEAQDALVRWLANRPAWRLRLSDNPLEAVPLLETLADRLP